VVKSVFANQTTVRKIILRLVLKEKERFSLVAQRIIRDLLRSEPRCVKYVRSLLSVKAPALRRRSKSLKEMRPRRNAKIVIQVLVSLSIRRV
jgi:Trp operon repressor